MASIRAQHSSVLPRGSQRGFSLLEMMVAIAILALSLGALYQAVSGATRNVRTAEKYAYGVELARSLLADNTLISTDGVNKRGETGGGFNWAVLSFPRDMPKSSLPRGALHNLEVSVSWQDGLKRRKVVLHSVVGAYGE
ncbi:MAG: prepilin-type N-terminal cleavage/methylation domain-containing protein [Proteobacteria bacterium]|nr:prepilin-type N-terminal cleavage/methylation domain-containing protein [Pseudomonadota bacterium]